MFEESWKTLVLLLGRRRRQKTTKTHCRVVAVSEIGSAACTVARTARFTSEEKSQWQSFSLGDTVQHGDLALKPAAHEATLGSHAMELTAVEFSLLAALAAGPDRVHTRAQLIAAIYGHNNEMSDRTIDSHIRNLRHKAKTLGCADLVRTVHGVGLRIGSCQT